MQLPHAVRRVTDPLFGGIRVPILSGVNRGRWWSLISAGGGYASGRRAAPQMELIESLIRTGDVVWDVGAHHGFVTLCAARRVGAHGAVHAFEPSARNRALLQRHVAWNDAANVAVHPYALSDFDGEARFGGTGTSRMLALGAGVEEVQVRRADSLVGSGTCAVPTFVKIDVEGAEADTVAGLLSVLPSNARLFIALHGPEADARCVRLLEEAGFRLLPSRALQESRTSGWRSDPDLFCARPSPESTRDIERLEATGF